MSLQNEILDLLLKLKNSSLSVKEKDEIKKKLKQLYGKMRKITKTPRIKSKISEEVETILKPTRETVFSDNQKIKSFQRTVNRQIQELEKEKENAASAEEQEAIEQAIESKKEDLKVFADAVKAGEAPAVIQRQLIAKEQVTAENFPEFVKQAYREKRSAYDNDAEFAMAMGKLLAYPLKRLRPDVWEKKGDRQKAYKELIEGAKQEIEEESAQSAAASAAASVAAERVARRKKAPKGFEKKEDFSASPSKVKMGTSKGFWTDDPENAQKYSDHSRKPKIIADFLELEMKAKSETIPMRTFTDFKQKMAEDISNMSPAEQLAIRRYVVTTRDKQVEEVVNAAREAVVNSTQSPDPVDVARLLTRDDQNKFLDWTKPLVGEGKKKSNYNYMRGGAGIADWMMTLGSIPGAEQLMNNMGPFGQVLGNATGLAQSFGKTAGQLIKEQSKDGEKVAGFTDTITSPLSGLAKMFGGKRRGGKKANMADMAGGAFISDFLGTLGGITPKLSGVIGAVPTYGKVATIGNSFLGSASRVGEDIAKMLGLGNMDTTLAGYGNIDLSNQKGYGRKKGGRKMLPLGRPMPRGDVKILPYGLQADPPIELNGGYGIGEVLYDNTARFAGDALKAGLKGLASAGLSVGKNLAKAGIQNLASQATTAIGNGKKRKIKGGFLPLLAMLGGKRKRGRPKKCVQPCMKGCGKIQGQWVSPDYEEQYEEALFNNKLYEQLQREAGARQMEAQIQQQLNVEQGNALTQLQYYDLLGKAQQRLMQEQQMQ